MEEPINFYKNPKQNFISKLPLSKTENLCYVIRKYLSIFISSILSGFCIVIGASVLLVQKEAGHPEFASFLFGFGLFVIINFKLWLYTGKIGALLDNKLPYLIDLTICCIGNFLGDFIMVTLLKHTRAEQTLIKQAQSLVDDKLNDNAFSVFILSFMCGIMIYLAVQGHKICDYPEGKALFVFMAVAIFILSKHEHCIANGIYFMYAKSYSFKSIMYILLMVLGDSVGSVAFDAMLKIIKWMNSLNEEFDKKKSEFKEQAKNLVEYSYNEPINNEEKDGSNMNTF